MLQGLEHGFPGYCGEAHTNLVISNMTNKLNVFPSGDSKKLKIKKSKNSKFTINYFLQK